MEGIRLTTIATIIFRAADSIASARHHRLPKLDAADDIELAQFLYLLIHNEKIRKVIDTITSKVVLILGRFTPPRKQVIDALHDKLRHHDYRLPAAGETRPLGRTDLSRPNQVTEWTSDDQLRQLVFIGVRTDKQANEAGRE